MCLPSCHWAAGIYHPVVYLPNGMSAESHVESSRAQASMKFVSECRVPKAYNQPYCIQN
ncbi:hypothetical protein ES705_45440 [subsurface metagenome]